jgi:hypothetical protein
MTRLLGNSVLYVTVCVLFVLAICANVFSGGSIPEFSTRLVPQSVQLEISHGPVPPPDPDVTLRLAHGPVPPPDPDVMLRLA